MVEEPPTSDASSTMATKDTVSTVTDQPEPTAQSSKIASQTETLAVAAAAANVHQTSNEATIESNTLGGTESTCNNDNAESSSLLVDGDGREKSLELADELMERGSMAVREGDYSEATECFSRSLEIRVAHYGELAPECVNLYYKYGCALLAKAQEEADPLGMVPKKDAESQQDSDKDGSVKNAIIGESSTASVSSNAQQDEDSNQKEGAADDGALSLEIVSTGKDQEEDEEESDVDDLAEADEDETDLDLAWKMLDVARAIVEKHSGDTMEKVDILSSLAEVALEREDVETSLSDYLKALSILERLVEPDHRYIAELNFRICLCLEIGSKAQEAIPYCQKAIQTCKSRVERLKKEVKSLLEARATSPSEVDQVDNQSSIASQSDDAVSDKEAEIGTLSSLSGELEKKLEDLQQLVSNPTSILSEILGMVAAKARGNDEKSASSAVLRSSQMGTANSNGDLDSPTVSTAHTNGASAVTHLGVVGRGIKRVLMNSGTAESNPTKKPALDPQLDKGEGSAS